MLFGTSSLVEGLCELVTKKNRACERSVIHMALPKGTLSKKAMNCHTLSLPSRKVVASLKKLAIIIKMMIPMGNPAIIDTD